MRIKQIGAVPAAAAVFALPAPRIVPLDLAAGQQPENIALEPDGSADRTAATGLYRVRPGTTPVQVAALPPAGFQNGVARDPASGDIFVADSFGPVVRRVSPRTGRVTDWATGALLAPVSGFGANGVKIHDSALWVSNLDRGTLVRFPLSGAPGRVVASGLGPVDDFAFHGDTVVAAVNQDNRVITVGRTGIRTILSTSDGLPNPTSVAVRGDTLYVADSAYFGGSPNLLRARLE